MASNPYKEDVDFQSLGLQDPDFAKVLKSNGQLDFTDPNSVQQLTKSLLKRDFGLTLTLPDDRLCPPVPNRLNYILWIQELLDTTSTRYLDKYDPAREVVGIDIGTGASCIYPLLGCARREKWKFIGTDIDEKSLQYAKWNVEANDLRSRIRLLQTLPESFFSQIPLTDISVDFAMCNPPFYSSNEEMVASAEAKRRPPFSACTGSVNEMVTLGGEVAFVSRMIEESLALREEIQWYTSMVGRLSSLTPLIERLKKHDISNYAVTEFVQGTKTRRWALGWSFGALRPTMSISRGTGSVPKALLPFPSEYYLKLTQTEPTFVGESINTLLAELPLKWTWKAGITTGLGFCNSAVWSRSARRLAVRERHDADRVEDSDEVQNYALGFKILVTLSSAETVMCIRWIQGQDTVLFESFCGMMKRKIEDFLKTD